MTLNTAFTCARRQPQPGYVSGADTHAASLVDSLGNHHTDRQVDTCTDTETDTAATNHQADNPTDSCTDNQADSLGNQDTDSSADSLADTETDRLVDTQAVSLVVSRILRPILGQGQRVHQTGDGPKVSEIDTDHDGQIDTRTYRVHGQLFWASSNDLVYQFDYTDSANHIVIDLFAAEIWVNRHGFLAAFR